MVEKPLRCVLRFHKWEWYGMGAGGSPGDYGTYRACRLCGKRRTFYGTAAAHDFIQSGMDDETQKKNPAPPEGGFSG